MAARCSLSMAFQENVHTMLFLETSAQMRFAGWVAFH
jgi:hypothetical protein